MNRKKFIFVWIFLVWLISGCSSQTTSGQQKYAIVTKSSGNVYNDKMVEGFQQAIEDSGNQCQIQQPEEATAESQILIVDELISQNIDGLAIAVNDPDALEPILKQAESMGIEVITLDSDTSKEGRSTFVNQVSAETLGKVLMEAVYDISGGAGQWAILSTTSQTTNQNQWIRAMQTEAQKTKYADMRLVDIVYGEDDYTTSTNCTRELLQEYPDLKVICAPTAVGAKAACQIVQQSSGKSVKVTGLGMPSELADYIGDGPEDPCPYLYLWDPEKTGEVAAYTLMELTKGSISGEIGQSFLAGDIDVFTFTEDANGNSEVIVGEPIKFEKDNIEEWKELF